MIKERLDRLLVSRGLVTGRKQAYAAIIVGSVKVDGSVCRKPDQKISEGAVLEYTGSEDEYVSRGGLKLERALDVFDVAVEGRIALDAGASTGGFTDCLLRRGAAKVFAVDVGYGQLAWKLRQDERVKVLERVNVRYLEPKLLDEAPGLTTIDVSFISLAKVLPAIGAVLDEKGEALALIKPQFEIGKGRVARDGVVRASDDHREVVGAIVRLCFGEGWSVLGLTWSPILGPKGNIEFWIHLSKVPSVGYAIEDIDARVLEVVEGAHEELVR